ncbi:hypothetical protein PG994_001406 [Apiospora phragmitis]|uniref:Uncharacterized protein n=1 Tax=Apiospora phragmitis TaxID=2905665 RepID=A0ABR1WTI5_9PEZI
MAECVNVGETLDRFAAVDSNVKAAPEMESQYLKYIDLGDYHVAVSVSRTIKGKATRTCDGPVSESELCFGSIDLRL